MTQQVNRVESGKKRYDFTNTQYFFGKTTNVAELMHTAVEDLLYQIYYQNADIQRAIADKNNLILEGGIQFKNKKGDILTDEKTEKIKDVLNYFVDFEDFKKEFNYYRNIFGNVYTYILEDDDGLVVGLQNLDPRFVHPWTDQNGFIEYYNYLNIKIDKYRIIHFKNAFDPNNKLKGMSPLVGGILDILGDNEASRSNFMFFLNNAVPASLIKFSDDLDPEELANILKMMNTQFSGGNNQHKIGGIQGVEGIEKLQKDFKDMEYKVLRDFSTEKVATCLGVPLTRLNKVNVTYNNMKEAFEQYIEATILNEERDIETHLNKIINYIYPLEDIKIETPNDHLDNSQYYTDLYIKQIDNGIITPGKAAELLGYDVIDEENQNKIYIKNGLIKIEDVGMPLTESLTALNFNETI